MNPKYFIFLCELAKENNRVCCSQYEAKYRDVYTREIG